MAAPAVARRGSAAKVPSGAKTVSAAVCALGPGRASVQIEPLIEEYQKVWGIHAVLALRGWLNAAVDKAQIESTPHILVLSTFLRGRLELCRLQELQTEL